MSKRRGDFVTLEELIESIGVDAARYFINWFTSHGADWAKSAKVPAAKEQAAGSAFKALTNLVPFAEEVPAVHFPPSVAGSKATSFTTPGLGTSIDKNPPTGP